MNFQTKMKILLFTYTVALLLVQCSSFLRAMEAKLGESAELKLGDKVTNVEVSIPNPRLGDTDRAPIVKDGTITNYGVSIE